MNELKQYRKANKRYSVQSWRFIMPTFRRYLRNCYRDGLDLSGLSYILWLHEDFDEPQTVDSMIDFLRSLPSVTLFNFLDCEGNRESFIDDVVNEYVEEFDDDFRRWKFHFASIISTFLYCIGLTVKTCKKELKLIGNFARCVEDNEWTNCLARCGSRIAFYSFLQSGAIQATQDDHAKRGRLIEDANTILKALQKIRKKTVVTDVELCAVFAYESGLIDMVREEDYKNGKYNQ